MAYKKHTWGSGIPNRNKFEEMDSEIQRLAEGGGLPPTGNLHEILKVGSTGPMWGKADSDFVNYIDTPTHENGSVGAKLSELSEKIVNINTDYSQHWNSTTNETDDIDTGSKWIDGKTIYKKVKSFTLDSSNDISDFPLPNDFDLLIKSEGYITTPNNETFSIPFCNVAGGGADRIGVLKMNSTHQLRFICTHTLFGGSTAYLTMYFTKSA